ncbi:MAG: uroporphyrinogen-III synthase [Pseudomonadota bacterium]|nr:uroporphyrinogen-III synthase [Pseudomonadota bacterium]
MSAVLILRAEPGASATAVRAAAYGLTPIVAPLFTLRAVRWDAPAPTNFDAVLFTSANAARLGGGRLSDFAQLPAYCVGETTAEAARTAGFDKVRIGPSDGAATVALMATDGIARALHLCGRDHIALDHPRIAIDRRVVYAADASLGLSAPAIAALGKGALVLLHSPRAASLFAGLADEAGVARSHIRLAAISAATAQAAGAGWAQKAIATAPRDEALLELAAGLCKTGDDQ